MNKHLLGFLIFFVAAAVLAACRKDDDTALKMQQVRVLQSDIAGVNGPTTGSVGDPLAFRLLWHATDSTLYFDHLKDSANENTRIVRLYATTKVDSLKADSIIKPITYTFKPSTPGTYYLKFYKTDNTDKSAIIDTVVVK